MPTLYRSPRPTRRLIASTLALLVVLLLTVAFVTWVRVHRALTRSSAALQDARHLPFTLRTLDFAALDAAGPGFEPIPARGAFVSGTVLAGRLYLTSPAGLHIRTASGTEEHLLRTGLELPAVSLGQVTAGRLRGAAAPQLMIATEGGGLLIVTPSGSGQPNVAQLLPAGPDLREVTALLVTPTGDLLLGTRRRGLLLYTGERLAPMPLTLAGTDVATLPITALASAGATILIGTRNAGVILLRGGVAERVDAGSGLPDDEVESLAADGTRAWVGTPAGVAEIELGSPGHSTRLLAPGLFAHALLPEPDGRTLLVGTFDQGIRRIALNVQPHLRNAAIAAPLEAAPASSAPVAGLISAGPAEPPLALSGSTVLHREPAGWTPLPATLSTGLTDPNISALAVAPDGRLWVGFFDRGLDMLNPDLTRAEHLEDDHLFCLNRLAVDPVHHTVAAATANGLVLFDAAGHPRQMLTRRDGLISSHINDLAFTASGLAVATPAGITFLDPAGASSLYAFEGLVNNHVYTLGVSPADPGQLIAGTLGGLSVLEGGTVRRNLTVSNSGLRHNWITALQPLPGQEPAWLVGTYGAGLERMAVSSAGVTTFVPIELPAGTPRDLVINPNALLVTPEALYAGTLGHGMLMYSKSAGRWSLLTAGLPSLNVTAFAQRGQGSASELFIGTDAGLVHIAESRLASFSGSVPR